MVAKAFSTKHISYYENRADHGYAWNVRFDLAFDKIYFKTTVKVDLVGANPGTLKNTWDSGVSAVWNNRGFFTDGTWTYGNKFDVQFVNSGAHQTVTVIAGTGRSDMTHWYTTMQGWGSSYSDEMAAHEFGHMFGLFDEYAGGATYANRTYSNAMMADFGYGDFSRYFWTIDYFAQNASSSSLNLVMPKGFSNANDVYTSGSLQDAILGFAGNDYLNAGAGGDWLDGSTGNDTLYGGSGHDQVFGGSGADRLYGGTDADRIFGQNDSDYIWGSSGRDTLSGGAGSDRFYFNTTSSSSNFDTISDFTTSDSLWLSGKIFAKLGTSVSSGELRLGTRALDSNDYLIYNSANGRLYYDADASKTKYAPVLVADLQNKAPVSYTRIKMFDALESLDNLTLSKSGGIEGFSGTYIAKLDVTYSWNFQAYSIPDTLRIWDNTGNYVNLSNKSGGYSGSFELRDNSNGQVKIAVSGSASGTVWDLHVQRSAAAPPLLSDLPDPLIPDALAALLHNSTPHAPADLFVL